MHKLTFILTLFLLYSCSSQRDENSNNRIAAAKQDSLSVKIWETIENKENWFKTDSKIYRSIDSLPAEFVEFYEKFISDSTFQQGHINFPITAVVVECDSTIVLTRENWKKFTWDIRKDFYAPNDSNSIYLDKDRFYYENIRKEIGLLFQIGFEKINGKWWLTFYIANTC